MKTCFKCKELKPLTEFYKHPKMLDGHLNKCKSCAKTDANTIYKAKMKIPEWTVNERIRQRQKERDRRSKGIVPKITNRKHYPKRMANTALSNALRSGLLERQKCEICGNENSQGHHEDYLKPLDVVWLCTRHHSDRHIHLRESKTLSETPMSITDFISAMQVG